MLAGAEQGRFLALGAQNLSADIPHFFSSSASQACDLFSPLLSCLFSGQLLMLFQAHSTLGSDPTSLPPLPSLVPCPNPCPPSTHRSHPFHLSPWRLMLATAQPSGAAADPPPPTDGSVAVLGAGCWWWCVCVCGRGVPVCRLEPVRPADAGQRLHSSVLTAKWVLIRLMCCDHPHGSPVQSRGARAENRRWKVKRRT